MLLLASPHGGGPISARLNRTSGVHNLLGGVDVLGGAASVQSVFSGRVGELVNGIPARVWDFTDPAEPSRWRERSIATAHQEADVG